MRPSGSKNSAFSKMSRQELVEFCRSLYSNGGIDAVSYPALKKHRSLYETLYRNGLPQKQLISALGLNHEYQAHKDSQPIRVQGGRVSYRWSWPRIVAEALSIKNSHSGLPPVTWFQANGYGSLVQAVYNLNKSWEMLREAVGDFEQSSFVESRNGIRWRSHPEASMSNFLYARGISHKRGTRYPDEYAQHSSAKYAYYDLHFLSKDGIWIDVEIWGDKPHGHNEQEYDKKRRQKEAYHAGCESFLGIHFKDCFSDEKLSGILEPFIGRIAPFLFTKAIDVHIQSSHWSNADELLDACRKLAESMPNGQFPTEEWLRKRGKWKDRPGELLNTMSIYIKLWLGGVRNLRVLLGQGDNSTKVWNKASAIEAYK